MHARQKLIRKEFSFRLDDSKARGVSNEKNGKDAPADIHAGCRAVARDLDGCKYTAASYIYTPGAINLSFFLSSFLPFLIQSKKVLGKSEEIDQALSDTWQQHRQHPKPRLSLRASGGRRR